MNLYPKRTCVRTSCAVCALLTTSTLLSVGTASTATAQTQLAPVTIETPRAKVKARVKPKRPEAVEQTVAEERNGSEAQVEEEKGLAKPLTSTTVSKGDVASKAPVTNDTATLLEDVPGVSVYAGGGVSSLPVIHGMADDRLKVMVNGAIVTSACSNHMNPALSYVDPASVKKIEVFSGVTPVSVGGDSIGGTILVQAGDPIFASRPDATEFHGGFSTFYRSVNNAFGGSVWASAATQNLSVNYNGAWSKAESYERGDGGPIVYASGYEAQNHMMSIAARRNGELFELEGGIQAIPYQGFPSVRMDMTGNDAYFIRGRYEKQFDWGNLQLRAFYNHTEHEMDILAERWKTPEDEFHMLMLTDGQDMGYSAKADIAISANDTIRVGNEFHRYLLEDWYPSEGQAPLDFLSVHDGERNRLGTFAEWERKWNQQWTTLLGVRNDIVWMDTGDVHGHNWTRQDYVRDATLFNSQEHFRLDTNLDLTALARYQPNAVSDFEFGYARKTRSPNLYERYAWYGYNGMISWFGDANGYHGNLDLQPEVAHTLSFTAGWHDRGRKEWELKITPYYTYVDDYIGVRQDFKSIIDFAGLTFVNHDAEIYGVDLSGRVSLWDSPDLGNFVLSGVLGFQHGENLDTGDGLYHMMPLNARLALEHRFGAWSNAVELQLVESKTDVEQARLEPTTPGYALVNLRSSYQWNESVRLDFGVKNLFDKLYYPPLAGRNVSENQRDWASSYSPLPGEGRNIYVGMSMKF